MTRPIPRPGVLDIDAYVPGKAGAPGAGRVFKLSANETPLGPSPAAVQALRDMAHEIAIYPEGSSAALREAVGARYGLNPARIIMGAGSDNILELLALAYIGPGDEGLYSQYGFLEYKIVTLAAGGVPVVAPETNYTANVDAILERVTQKTKIVFLANPNNPTGSYLPAAEVERLAKGLPARTLLVLDAAYAEYVMRADYEAGIALVNAHENVVMTRTFSKIYRSGGRAASAGDYGPAQCDRFAQSLSVRRSTCSSAASIAGVAAVQDTAHRRGGRLRTTRNGLPWLTREISSLGTRGFAERRQFHRHPLSANAY